MYTSGLRHLAFLLLILAVSIGRTGQAGAAQAWLGPQVNGPQSGSTFSGACPDAQPIGDVRTQTPGSEVTVEGLVTVPTGVFTDNRSFALQDATGGIYVYGKGVAGTVLDPGDEVCVMGRLALYHGLLEIAPASVTRLRQGIPVMPKVVQPAAVGEATEGLLISITGPAAEVDQNPFRVGGAAVYLDRDTGATAQALVEGCPVTVVGLSADYDGSQVWPRAQEDIVPQACRASACDDYTIAQIQGPGAASPRDGAQGLSCLAGCVTGVASDGFYLQSTTPDEDSRTSEGIYVYRYDGWANPQSLNTGDLVEVRGFAIQEFYGSTEVVGLKDDRPTSYRKAGPCSLPDPVPLPVMTDPDADPEAEYESYEGMRVMMSFDGLVSGPTTRYPGRFPGGEAEIALVDRGSPLYGRRVFAGDMQPGRGMIYLSGGLGRDLPDVGVGDRLSGHEVTGILAYQFGRYVLLPDACPACAQRAGQPGSPLVAEDAPDLADPETPIGPDEFAICSFNLENLFDHIDDGDGDMGEWAPTDRQAFALSVEKRAVAIRTDLQRCTVIGLQEVEGKDAVWQALAEAVGAEFRYDYYESTDERDITNGILYDATRVTLRHSDLLQACTPVDYGVDPFRAVGARSRPSTCAPGTYPLFDRPPYLAELTIRNAGGDRSLDLQVIVNHFKSRLGDETVNQIRRGAQARHVAALLTGANAVALGDFNDSLDSEALAWFAGFANLFEAHLPRSDRYTYIYNGQSEVLDHFVMTPGLDRYFKSGSPVHINADFPERREPDRSGRRSSDHDPIFVRFGFLPTGVSEALAGLAAGAVAGEVEP